MKKWIVLLTVFVLIVALTGCAASVPVSTTGSGSSASTGSNASASTAAAAISEKSQTHEAEEDYTYDAASALPIALNGNSIATTAQGVTVAGSHAIITQAGVYTLTGMLDDGQVAVNVQGKGTVWLILNGVEIFHPTSAPIYVMDAEKVILVLASGRENKITSGEGYLFASSQENEPNAAIYSKADLTITGSGSLLVNANAQDGIASKDGLIIDDGTITVSAVDDGIRGKDYLVVNGGSLTVNAQGDGLKSDNEEDAALGYISVSAGRIQVSTGGDAIYAQSDVLISGGTFTLISGGGSMKRASATTSAKGIKGTARVSLDGGTFTIDSADDAINSKGSITITDGAFQLASADDGIHADQTLTINGGNIRITRSYEGLESAVITLTGGNIHLTASDDGVNVAEGNDGSGMTPGARPAGRGGPGQVTFTYTGKYYLYIHGGYLFVEADGDGIDVNGAIEMTGGTVLVNGPTAQMNGALDYDAGFKMSGGTMLAVGSAGMAMSAGQGAGQNSVLIYLSSTQRAGTLVHIQDQAGQEILTFAPTRDYQSLAFSAPTLALGASYTVFTGGQSTGAVQDGLYRGGIYTGGTQVASFTISSAETTAGSGGRMGPGRHP